MNLLCGLIAVVFAFEGRADIAFPLMLAAAFFDLCDGMAARALKVSSPIGGELDSLSDMVSFGVLPSVMLFKLMEVSGAPRIACFVPLLLPVFSALRLARFNVDDRQHETFLGLATPACAMLCGSFAAFCKASPGKFMSGLCGTYWFIPVLTALLCVLLVCGIPMFSFKGGKDSRQGMKRIAFLCITLLLAIMLVVLGGHWTLLITGAVLAYILMNLIFAVFKL